MTAESQATGARQRGGVSGPVLRFFLVLVAGIGLLAWGTYGFSIFTAETARRQQIIRQPQPLPAIALEDEQGRLTGFDAFAGKVILVDFIYTRCLTLCSVLGSTFEQLRAEIEAAGERDAITLLSLSFDPDYDTPARLDLYARRYGGADAGWTLARAARAADTRQLLEAARVIVIPDGLGGFVHNAAILVVDGDGRLVRIFDPDDWQEALAFARQLKASGSVAQTEAAS